MSFVKYILVMVSLTTGAFAHQIFQANSPARASNIYLDPANPINGRSIMNFKLKAEGQSLSVQSVTVTIRSSLSPTAVSVWNGSTQLGSSVQTTGVPVNVGASVTIPADTSLDFVVKVDLPAGVTGNHWLYAELNSVTSSQGEADIQPTTQFTGPTFYCYPNGVANFTLTGVPTAVTTTSQAGYTETVTATFPLRLRATGGDVTKLTNQSVKVVAVKPPYNTVLAQAVSVVTIPNANTAAGGQSTVTVTAQFAASDFLEGGHFGFQISQINWNSVNQTWGLEDFKVPNMVNIVLPQGPAAKVRVTQIGDLLYSGIDYWSGYFSGTKGQVAGEGQSVVINSSASNQVHYFIFPVTTSTEKGNRFRVDVSQSSTQLIPSVSGPATITGNPFFGNMTSYTPTNVVETTVSGVVTKVTFDVTFDTLVVHVTVDRMGDFSHRIICFWGEGSTYTSPGTMVDLLNLSGTISGTPQRFQFVSSHGTSPYSMQVTALLFSFTVEQSEDLVTWTPVGYSTSYSPLNADGTQTTTVFLTRAVGYNPARLFYRAVLNQ